MVFVGLPIIGKSLPIADYAIFLYGMALVSIINLLFGAPGILYTRELARSYSLAEIKDIVKAENSALGFFIVIFAIGSIIILPFVWETTEVANRNAMLILTGVALLSGLFRIGNIDRVASRTDHISSLWQFGGNAVVIVLLLTWKQLDLLIVVLVYFGVPLLVQIIIVIQILIEKHRIPCPSFDFFVIRNNIKSLLPILLFQAGEYSKIYLSAIAVSMVSDDTNYTRFATIILIAARLVNPVSLITRPLMPAYVDARHHRDDKWLKRVKAVISYMLIGCYTGAMMVVLVLDPSIVHWLLPSGAPEVSQIEIGLIFLFVGSQGFTTLLAPLFFAGDGTKFLAYVNFLSVFAAIAIGSITTVYWGSIGMLAAMGIGGTVTLSICLGYAYRQLLTLPVPKRNCSPTE